MAVCLTFCAAPIWTPKWGWGWVHACVSLLRNFPHDLATHLFTPVLDLTLPNVRSTQTYDPVQRCLPRSIRRRIFAKESILAAARHDLEKRYLLALEKADPRTTIAHFWPGTPRSAVREARRRGIVSVFEMINTQYSTTRPLLRDAYSRVGIEPPRKWDLDRPDRERSELFEYDYILAPSAPVVQSLLNIELDSHRIVRTSFGWEPSRFQKSAGQRDHSQFKALFVGTLSVRKGTPQLLAAWKKSGVKGQLVLTGYLEDDISDIVAPYRSDPSIKFLGMDAEVGALYKSCNALVFPTIEEGAPQATYEAAGCGLPIITTAMGSAGIVEDGRNGLIVSPHDVEALAAAIRWLAEDPELRQRLGKQAAMDAQQFTYERVGRARGELLKQLILAHNGRTSQV